MSMKAYFDKALPIWKKDAEKEVNMRMRFKAETIGKKETVVRLACSDAYQMFVNGEFVAAGPARAAKDFFRVDEINVTPHLIDEVNYIAFIVCSYNAASYQYAKNEGFFCCEIIKDGIVESATGINGFVAGICNDYIRETDRYSFQRQFTEVLRFKNDNNEWKCGGDFEICDISVLPKKQYLDRHVRYPEYERCSFTYAGYCGKFNITEKPVYKKHLWYNSFQNNEYFNYTNPSEDIFSQICSIEHIPINYEFSEKEEIFKNNYKVYEINHNATGFLSVDIVSKGECVVYFLFDEMMGEGVVDATRLDCKNALKFYLSEGKHEILSFEPYTMKYLSVYSTDADVVINNLELIEYKHPSVKRKFNCSDKKLKMIYDAAVETFRQNALDIYMDCPSRERAGWLCDSYFTARAEDFLCGENLVEENFLGNYILPNYFKNIPNGMFPMCYPAEHTDGNYIPNWAMWLVLEIYDHYNRTGKYDLAERYKGKIYNLLAFFEKYEEENGLLKDLDKWVFVDWSVANDYTSGINFPTNMMYAYMNECAGILYSDKSLIDKAESIRRKVREMSYNGEFFVDNFDGGKECRQNISEACQYYAFFTKTATKEMYPELWNTILKELGPNISNPKVGKANAFVGNYIRLLLLERENDWERILDETAEYFYYMAEKTGTLWEKIDDRASLNHGFASYAAVLIYEAVMKKNYRSEKNELRNVY